MGRGEADEGKVGGKIKNLIKGRRNELVGKLDSIFYCLLVS